MHVEEDFADQRREDGVDTARTVGCTSSKAFMSLLTIALVAPTYERLADAFPSVRYYIYTKMKDLQLTDILQNKIIIAKTDADGVGRELGSRFGVSGFPSMFLKLKPLGSVILTDSQLSSGSLLAPLSPYLTAALETSKPLLHCQYYHFGCAKDVLLIVALSLALPNNLALSPTSSLLPLQLTPNSMFPTLTKLPLTRARMSLLPSLLLGWVTIVMKLHISIEELIVMAGVL